MRRSLRAMFVVAGLLVACSPGQPGQPAASTPDAPATAAGANAGPTLLAEQVVGANLTKVRIYGHTLTVDGREVGLWIFVSDGLARRGQTEIVFSVAREPGEAEQAYPRDVLEVYTMLDGLAAEGRLVDAGGTTLIGPDGPGLLARADFRGIYYAQGQAIPGMEIPSPFLTGLFVTSGEREHILEFGQIRFLTGLGQLRGYFPFPPWTDRTRPELARSTGLFEQEVGRISASGLTISLEPKHAPIAGDSPLHHTVKMDGARIVLRIAPPAFASLDQGLAALAQGAGVVFFAELDGAANSVFAHVADGQDRLALGCSEGSAARIAGKFVTVGPAGQDELTMVEDGLAVLFVDATWKRVAAALHGRQPLTLELKSGHTFVIEWPTARDLAPLRSYCKG